MISTHCELCGWPLELMCQGMQACQMTKVVKKGWAVVGLPDTANGWQGTGAPGSALLAMRSHHIVQRFVCLASLRQVIAF